MRTKPSRFLFVIKSDDAPWLTFAAIEKDIDAHTRAMAILQEKSGCVTMTFDPSPAMMSSNLGAVSTLF